MFTDKAQTIIDRAKDYAFFQRRFRTGRCGGLGGGCRPGRGGRPAGRESRLDVREASCGLPPDGGADGLSRQAVAVGCDAGAVDLRPGAGRGGPGSFSSGTDRPPPSDLRPDAVAGGLRDPRCRGDAARGCGGPAERLVREGSAVSSARRVDREASHPSRGPAHASVRPGSRCPRVCRGSVQRGGGRLSRHAAPVAPGVVHLRRAAGRR